MNDDVIALIDGTLSSASIAERDTDYPAVELSAFTLLDLMLEYPDSEDQAVLKEALSEVEERALSTLQVSDEGPIERSLCIGTRQAGMGLRALTTWPKPPGVELETLKSLMRSLWRSAIHARAMKVSLARHPESNEVYALCDLGWAASLNGSKAEIDELIVRATAVLGERRPEKWPTTTRGMANAIGLLRDVLEALETERDRILRVWAMPTPARLAILDAAKELVKRLTDLVPYPSPSPTADFEETFRFWKREIALLEESLRRNE